VTVVRGAVARVFYQEIKAGDRRKIQASSNDAQTGGGARDLRIPKDRFWDFFGRMLPARRRDRSNNRTVEVLVGRVKWDGPSGVVEHEIAVWPPTDPRPTEIRIAQVNKNFPPGVPEGRPFVLVVQTSDGEIWGLYTTETDLRTGDWDRRIQDPILRCIDNTPETRSIRGYVDLDVGFNYCHG
jgi:hypothetical protein